ncbi:MAG: LysR family transcriptional regulator [Candidatus Leucobacter sulfamidivorax]|nr:LysR family transcriptional regulator [Candidatus Leucobacter sulfamidivorax]
MLRLTLRQLEYFVAVAAAGSISAAAERINVSRSALASALDDLEAALGAQLVVRTKSAGVALTPIGLEVREQALALIRSAGEIEGVATDELAGPLHCGCFVSVAPTLFPALLELFKREHPRVEPHLAAEPQDVLIERMRRGELEAALLYDVDLDPELRRVPVFSTRLRCIVAADHPLAELDEIPVTALAAEPLILVDTPPSPAHVAELFRAHDVEPLIRHRTSQLEVARSLVAAGLGYSITLAQPRSTVSYEGRPLVTREIAPRPEPTLAVAAWPAGRILSANARRFVEFLRRSAPLMIEGAEPPAGAPEAAAGSADHEHVE